MRKRISVLAIAVLVATGFSAFRPAAVQAVETAPSFCFHFNKYLFYAQPGVAEFLGLRALQPYTLIVPSQEGVPVDVKAAILSALGRDPDQFNLRLGLVVEKTIGYAIHCPSLSP